MTTQFSNVTGSPEVTVRQKSNGPGCLIRYLYFLFVGLWLGGIWILVAWVLNITIIGLPLGMMMLNSIPQVMTLKPSELVTRVRMENGRPRVIKTGNTQLPWLLRAFYFLLIGWWLSLIWMGIAWFLTTVTLGLGLPIAFWMFDCTPALTTLAR
jgi:uncharacterized membrane protein YccF (DUF307 family)